MWLFLVQVQTSGQEKELLTNDAEKVDAQEAIEPAEDSSGDGPTSVTGVDRATLRTFWVVETSGLRMEFTDKLHWLTRTTRKRTHGYSGFQLYRCLLVIF